MAEVDPRDPFKGLQTSSERKELTVIALGLILIVLALIVPALKILFTIGAVLLIIGLVLLAAGLAGRGVGGRRYWW